MVLMMGDTSAQSPPEFRNKLRVNHHGFPPAQVFPFVTRRGQGHTAKTHFPPDGGSPATRQRRSRYLPRPPCRQPLRTYFPPGTLSPQELAFPCFSIKENAVEITLMSDQALINELLSPGHAEPMAADSHPYIQTALPLATQASQQQRLRRILDLSKELLMRDLRHDWILRPMVNSPAAFKEWLRLRFANLEHEIFLVVFLDAQQRIIDAEVMFRGTLTQTSVYPREVVKAAMRHNAAAIAMAHNHPSGHVEPSTADRQLTQTLRSALALVDVRCVDHFIVAGDRLLSMAEQGLM